MNNTSEVIGIYAFKTSDTVLWYFVFSLICVLAVVGNSTVIYVIATRRYMQTVTNYFIVNLAIADALTGSLCIPFRFQAALTQRWIFPAFLCNVAPFIDTMNMSVSVLTLTAISVDRLRMVLAGTPETMSQRAAKTIVGIIWAFSLACSLPYGCLHHILVFSLPDNSSVIAGCWPRYLNYPAWKWYNIYLTIVQYFVPVIIINVTYIFIAYHINQIKTAQHDLRLKKSKRKVLRLLIFMMMGFTFCWLPYEIYLVLAETTNVNHYYYINVIFFTIYWLAMSNSCLNPIIYGVYNEKMRREFKVIIKRLLCRDVGSELEAIARANSRSTANSSVMVKHSTVIANNALIAAAANKAEMSQTSTTTKGLHRAMSVFACKEKAIHLYIASELGHDFLGDLV